DITDRKRAEAAVRESERHYHLLADNVSDVIWTAGREMDLTYISPSVTALTGYTPEEFLRLKADECLTPDSFQRLIASREEVLARIGAGQPETVPPAPQVLELEYRCKNGSTIWAEVVISLIRGSEGEPQGVIGVTRDITERKLAEAALKNSEEYLQTIINGVQTGLVIIDPRTHTIIDVNPAAERMIGVGRDKLIGSICHKYICPAEAGSCPVTDLGQAVDNSERTLITVHGPRSILKTVVPAEFSGEQYLLESFIDITDRKRAEERLIESEERFHLIFRNSNDAIYLFEITASGMPGRIVDANEVAVLQTGLTKENLVKKTFLEIHTHELPTKSRAIMMELLTKGQIRFETEVQRRDGTKLPVEVSAQFAKLNQKTYVIAISRDISRRKREERALRIANQKLQLMNIVAWHDIQNKVTGLRGYVELSKDLVTDETMKKFIQSEEEALKVIHQQLQYTKEYQEMGVHPQEWVNLHQTLRMILSLAELGSIQVIVDVGDLEVYCDPVIAKVFSHLLDNTKIHGKKATRIHISCRETPDGLTLAYEDDGVGIADEQKKELFMRNVGTTTGFSLFFIHDLLEVSEMTIRETGVCGQGVRFEIGIPRGIYRFGRND
ncbi:MAG: PAS domain S-box protein, partial [Methanomicrobiales archaeon]|nr:PAS domain S-box protein [Methanomicrobiales archaeon]